MPLCSASASPDSVPKSAQSVFRAEGVVFPSWRVFRDALADQFLNAKSRICVLSQTFEDRQLASFLHGAAQRGLLTALRLEPLSEKQNGRLERLAGELRILGVSVSETSLKPLKINEPSLVAIDQKAWSIDAGLSEFQNNAIEIEASRWTADEVCRWAQAAQSAKPATSR
ncbi:MAG: hypothetical protein ACO3A4_06220 [Silvanigrellaceae bacterium]